MGPPKQRRYSGLERGSTSPRSHSPLAKRVIYREAGPRLSLQSSKASLFLWTCQKHESKFLSRRAPLPGCRCLHNIPTAQGVILESASGSFSSESHPGHCLHAQPAACLPWAASCPPAWLPFLRRLPFSSPFVCTVQAYLAKPEICSGPISKAFFNQKEEFNCYCDKCISQSM